MSLFCGVVYAGFLFCHEGDGKMLLEQEAVAEQTKAFLVRWGLKAKYVAKVCGISEKTFSRFLNHKLALSKDHIIQL